MEISLSQINIHPDKYFRIHGIMKLIQLDMGYLCGLNCFCFMWQ